MISLSWGAPTELGWGSHPPWYWTQGPLYSVCRWAYQCTSPPRWDARTGALPLERTPLLLMVHQLPWGDSDDCSWASLYWLLSPQGAGNFCKTRWRAWGLMVGQQQHLLQGRSSRHVCLLSSNGVVDDMGCWQGPPWAGPVASAMAAAVVGVSQDWFHWPGWTESGTGYKNFLLCKGDQWLHCPLELHHTLCQTVQFTRT